MILYGRKMSEVKRCPRCKCTKLLDQYFTKNKRGEWFASCDRCRIARTKTYVCPHKECNLSFNQSGLSLHIESDHKNQRFECSFDDCDASYKNINHLYQHNRIIHEESESFTCPYEECKKVFTQNSNLTTHIKMVHTIERDHECPYEECEYSSCRKCDLQNHIESVHLEIIKYECSEENCDYKCYHKSNLITHIKMVHNNIRDCVCSYDDCDKAFSRNIELQKHIKAVHLNIRDFVCPNENCDYSASDLSNYKRHLELCTNGEVGSHGEVLIKRILNNMNVKYVYDKSYSKMTKQTGRPLRFDFRIITDGEPLVIEFDGKQHYGCSLWEGEDGLLEIQTRDRIKNGFCQKNDILLLRIPYWEKKNMKKIIHEFVESNTSWTSS